MTATESPPRLDPRLRYELARVLRAVQALKAHRRGTWVWSGMSAVAAAGLLVPLAFPAAAPQAVPVVVPAFVLAAAVAGWLAWRDRAQLADAVEAIARQDPAVASRLRTAVEQSPGQDGKFHFLQRRLFHETLLAANARDWALPIRRRARQYLAAHALAIVAALGLSVLVLQRHPPPAARASTALAGVEITPGDAEVERGSAVLVAGRFGAPLPASVVLVWQPDGAAPERIRMDRSLSDPVFAATLRNVAQDGVYQLEYDGRASPPYQLRVYDLPALVRADAALDYPDYTGLANRRVEDVRTISAVVGTDLTLEIAVNQPVARAVLQRADGTALELTARDAARTRFELQRTIAASERFILHLQDDAGRANRIPPQLRIEAVPNRRPELRITFPRGDRRVSPLEEVSLQGEARDDFGLQDYGIGLSVGASEPDYVSLADGAQLPALEARFLHLLPLERHQLEPNQLITWFAWADDIGPDGQVRRTTSELAFAEVRPFEEIFRENSTGGGANAGAGGAGGPADELIEIQRQLSIAIWNLRQSDADEAEFAGQLQTLRDSQLAAQQQLGALRSQLMDSRSQAAAEEASTLMERTSERLADAAAGRPEPLDPAWAAARGAYQALLRLQPDETQVAQSRSPGGAGGRRGQGQLDQLEFRNEEDRYATETQAEPPPTPEEREQLQVLARLRELARRQQHLNDRLQELQTALAAADEARQEEIRRELKRLEDEQRRLLAELDESRERVDRLRPGERTQQAREQLEQTREAMQRAGEQLAEGEISQALAAGTRARENLQRTNEELRSAAAGRLGGQMREARRQARELAEAQEEVVRDLDSLGQGRQLLDDSRAREALAQRLEAQRERRTQLLDTLRQVTEDSEAAEPQLHRQLYDLLRAEARNPVEPQLENGAQLLRRGFIEPLREPQNEIARTFENLQRAVERAAESVLGDETTELRFAQRELDDLTQELRRERPAESRAGSSDAPGEREPSAPSRAAEGSARAPGSEASGEAASALSPLEQFARATGEARRADEAAAGPLTGAGFAPWAERLRTVEELMEDPDLRQRLAQARFQAEELRREHQRHGQRPRWDLVDSGVVAPLTQAQDWLRQELRRRLQPDSLQPIDRDPVPERYAEAVRKYYESLGEN